MKINNLLTHVQNPEDKPFLRTALLDVNMRLFKSSVRYRVIVRSICDYVREVSLMEFEDYQRPFGMSGANLAIPFNIIGLVQDRGGPKACCDILINPKILEYHGPLAYAQSNCGSIRLTEPIDVLRYDSVKLDYFDEEGRDWCRWFSKNAGAYTVQHEVDHNLGILITDYGRVVKDEERPKTASL